MHQATEAAAARVAAKRRELEERLAELRQAHPLRKMEQAPLIAATFLELLDHQSAFNQAAIAELAECRAAEEAIAKVLAGCATIASSPASST